MKSNKDRAMKENKNTEMPSFVYRDGMTADKEYVEWLSDVKTRFRQCQIKASIRVNTTMLELYWSIGRDLVTLRAEERWGAGVVKQFALDMRQAFPDANGFSLSNIKYMKQWYLFYFEEFTKSSLPPLDLSNNPVESPLTCTFAKPDMEKFPMLALGFKAASLGGAYPIAFNAANEIAVEAFINHEIGFYDISNMI